MTMNRDEMMQKIISKMEADTGKTLDQFVKMVKAAKLTKHKEILNFFKDEQGLSYGYANTMAHAVRDVLEGVKSEDALIEEQYAGDKAHLKSIYDEIIKAVEKFGKDVEISPKKAYVSLRRKTQFAIVQPSTKTRMDIGLIIKGKDTTDRLEAAGSWNSMCTHRIRLTEKGEVDTDLIEWLKEAYTRAG